MAEQPDSRRARRGLRDRISELRERHCGRHRPTGFGFAFADRVDFLDPVRWDAIARGASVFLRRDGLRAIETHGPENIEPRYAIIFRGDAPVAIMAVQIVTVTGERFRRDTSVSKAVPRGSLLPADAGAGGAVGGRPFARADARGGQFAFVGFSRHRVGAGGERRGTLAASQD